MMPARMTHAKTLALVSALGIAAAFVACGGGHVETAAKPVVTPGGSLDPSKWPKDDRSRCEGRGQKDLIEATTTSVGSPGPNVRRIFRVTSDGTRTIVCRETDTNLDGIKDTFRFYDPKGEPLREEADTNFDGKIDTWTFFIAGKPAQVDVDHNGDGNADEWRYYGANGVISRIKRDRNGDGKPDVFEVYARGKLERIGFDESFTGHVDRWDRSDESIAAERAEEESGGKDGGATDGGTASGGDASGGDGGAQ